MGNTPTHLVIAMKENGKRIKQMDMGYLSIQMGPSTTSIRPLLSQVVFLY